MSTILSPSFAGALGYGLVSLSALVVVTCAGATRGPVSARAAVVPSPSVPALRTNDAPPAASPSTAGAAPVAFNDGHSPRPGLNVARFRAALSDLAGGRRSDSVRVLWLGDSHAAADFWPDAVRRPLQAKYGSGGPGFLYLGLGVYRHAGATVERAGRWRAEPKKPSLWMWQDDGVFGLGGIRAVADGETSRLTIALAKDAIHGSARWNLAFRLPTNKASFRVSVDSRPSFAIDSTTQQVGAVAHLEWQADPAATIAVDQVAGGAQIFGAVVESAAPGVVVDTLGINGARIGTPLAWDEEAWVKEAGARNASLFVLAYGTNEVGDQVAPRRYAPELESLVARVRRAAPDADCVVVGPTDREGPGWVTLPRVLEIDATEREAASHAGCAFFSTIAAMGGEGSLGRWAAAAPPLAAPDHVHLTPRGYAQIGAQLAAELVPGLPPKVP